MAAFSSNHVCGATEESADARSFPSSDACCTPVNNRFPVLVHRSYEAKRTSLLYNTSLAITHHVMLFLRQGLHSIDALLLLVHML